MLKETIKNEMIKFMKAKDKVRLTAIRGVNADIKNKEIELKRELNDEEVIAIVGKSIKQYNETLEFAKKVNDQEKSDEINICIEFLGEFMPEQLTDDEARAIVEAVVNENGFEGKKDIGKVMKKVMPRLKGKFDGKKVNQIVGEVLK